MRATPSKSYFPWLLALLGLNLYVVWSARYFTSEDGPNHIAIASTVKSLWQNHCPNISALYHFTQSPVPTWIVNFIVIPLLSILDPWVIEKILFSLAILSFGLSIYLFLRVVARENSWFIIPIMIFAFNYMAYTGGYNFLLSFALYFVILSWWFVKGRNHNLKNFIILTLLMIVEYFFHLFGLATVVLSIAAVELYQFCKQRDLRTFFKRIAYYFLSAIPVIILFYFYYILPKMETSGVIPFSERILYLLTPIILATISKADYYLMLTAMVFIWLLLALILRKYFLKTSKGNPETLCITLTFAICMLATPASFAGGWVIEPRIQLYLIIFMLIWAAGFSFSSRERKIIITISILLSLFNLYNKYEALKVYGKILGAYDEAKNHIPDYSTIISVDLSPFTIDYATSEQNMRFSIPNITGFLIAGKTCIAEVNNRSIAEKNSFPVSYNDDKNPSYALGRLRTSYGLGIMPPEMNIAAYTKNTGVKVDYIILRGRKENMLHYQPDTGLDENKLYANLMRQVNLGFELSYQSADGLVAIYKAKP